MLHLFNVLWTRWNGIIFLTRTTLEREMISIINMCVLYVKNKFFGWHKTILIQMLGYTNFISFMKMIDRNFCRLSIGIWIYHHIITNLIVYMHLKKNGKLEHQSLFTRWLMFVCVYPQYWVIWEHFLFMKPLSFVRKMLRSGKIIRICSFLYS